MSKLILASTFRHYFLGLALTQMEPKDSVHILFIDQKVELEKNKLISALLKVSTPFASIEMIEPKKTHESKRQYRKNTFIRIAELIQQLCPSEIIAGNDRRTEFQFAMSYARRKLNVSITGSYLDDGTGSYRNMYDFNRFGAFSDKYVDTFFKKLAYGNWYSRPKSLGASHWVTKCYLTFPEIALKTLAEKENVKLDQTAFNKEQIKFHLINVVKAYGLELGSDIDESKPVSMFMLPHSSIVNELYSDANIIREQILSLTKSTNVFAKYHPREAGDPLELGNVATLLPSEIPAEIFLAIWNVNLVLGDVSTALMSAAWLRPNCEVRYIDTKSDHTSALKDIFKHLSITAWN